MRRGDERGYMHHPRRGLIGAVQDWAAGSRANVVKIMLRLIRWFGVEGDVREKLGAEQSRAAPDGSTPADGRYLGLLWNAPLLFFETKLLLLQGVGPSCLPSRGGCGDEVCQEVGKLLKTARRVQTPAF
jgi:hypothetical protein